MELILGFDINMSVLTPSDQQLNEDEDAKVPGFIQLVPASADCQRSTQLTQRLSTVEGIETDSYMSTLGLGCAILSSSKVMGNP